MDTQVNLDQTLHDLLLSLEKRIKSAQIFLRDSNQRLSLIGLQERVMHKANQLARILDMIMQVGDRLPVNYLSRAFAKIEENLTSIERFNKEVDLNAIPTHIDNPRTHLAKFEQEVAEENLEFFDNLDTALTTLTAVRQLQSIDLARLHEQAGDIVGSLNSNQKEADAIVSTLRDSASEAAVRMSLSSYSTLSADHGKREKAWFVSTCAAFCLLLVAVGVVIFRDPMASLRYDESPPLNTAATSVTVTNPPTALLSDTATNPAAALASNDAAPPSGDAVPNQLSASPKTSIVSLNLAELTAPGAVLVVMRNALLIGVPLLLLRVSLTKYNAERHLRILYNHRIAALKQLQILEASIPEDNPAKNMLRLEAAKMILSDPITSYSSHTDSTELNISPVFSAFDRMTGRGKSD